ncbi:MAG: ABC transporter permease, partial [Clostridium sp.]
STISLEEVNGEKIFAIPSTVKDSNGTEFEFNLEGREKDGKLFAIKEKKGNELSFKDNIITSNLAKSLGVKEGDYVEVKNKLDGKSYKVKIDKIGESLTGDRIYVPLEEFYELTGYPKGSYISLISEKPIELEEGMIKSHITKDELIKGIKDLAEPLLNILYFIGGVSAFIACALLFVVATLVVTEKGKEISLYKILGYKNNRIQSIILNGNIILVVLGFLIALPLCNKFFEELFKEITKDMEFTLSGELSFSSIFIIFIVLCFSFFISLLLAKRGVKKVSMEEALKRGRE